MGKKIVGLAAGAALALGTMAGSASATEYFTYLDWTDFGGTVHSVSQANAYGKVIIDTTGTGLNVEVDLYSPLVGFLNTGSGSNNNTPGNEQPFTFNTSGAFNTTVHNTATQTFFYVDGTGANNSGYNASGWSAGPFGHFSNYIGCCDSPTNIVNGSGAASPPPLKFTIQGATIDNLLSNTDGATASPERTAPGHWWFQADVTDGSNTFHIAAQDLQTAVPEPATWALMIVGFGGLGAMMRRQRALATA